MTPFPIPTGIDHLSMQELQALYARIYADLICNTHSIDEETQKIFALQRITAAIARKRMIPRP